jgi:hypothetical protein
MIERKDAHRVRTRQGERSFVAGHFGVVVATVVLACGLASPAAAQTRCTRDGDWLICEDGQRYAIRVDPFSRSRGGGGRGQLVLPGDAAQSAGPPDSTLLQTADGLVCWRHGDHVHCQ